MISFLKNNWIGGLIAVIYFLLFFFILPLDVACNYHSTSDYCVGFISKSTIPPFLPQSLLAIDLAFFAPVFWLLNYLNTHLTPIDPNDTALIILLSSVLFYIAGNIVWGILKKIFKK